MAVKIGQREVIADGSVIVDSDNMVTIEVRDLIVSIRFGEDAGEPRVQGETISGKELSFTLIGFKNVLGTAYSAKIGDVDGKPLIMALWVESLSKDNPRRWIRLLSYTFSVGEGFVE
jgi:hypothetical protein